MSTPIVHHNTFVGLIFSRQPTDNVPDATRDVDKLGDVSKKRLGLILDAHRSFFPQL